jgi:lipopolysaccharide/colanic/teichoic acid biosynthesis glycosyltransferase
MNLLSKLLKSGLDRLMAAIAIVVFYPFILFLAIAISLRMGRAIVFTQPRLSPNHVPVKMVAS